MTVVILLGHEYPPGSGQMSERLLHLPALLLIGLAAVALGFARAWTSTRWPIGIALVVTLAVAARDLRFETNLLREAARDPDLSLARDVARAIESVRHQGECVSVSSPPTDPVLLSAYVAKVEAAFGDVQEARARAAALAMASPDRDRIAAHLRAPTGTVETNRGCALVVDIDNAFRGGASDQAAPPDGFPKRLAEITAGPRRAVLSRTRP